MRLARTASVSIRTLAATLALLLVRAPDVSWADDEQLKLGIRQVEGGEFDAAVITLDGVARRLAAAGDPKERARAYTYLAIAYLGLAQEQSAKARFLDALKADPGLQLDPKDFPPKVVQFFDQVRAGEGAPGAATTSPAAGPPVAPATAATLPPKKEGGGSKTLLVVLGVGGAAGIAAVAAGGGGGGGGGKSQAPPPTTIPPATLSDLTARVSSPQHNTNLNCTEPVFATVTLTNNARSSVSVSGVRREGSVVSGGCNPARSFTFTTSVPIVVAGGSSSIVLDNRALYSGGSGCCNSGDACDGRTFCQFQERFVVITSVGEVNAGAIGFGVRFRRCQSCSAASGFAAVPACPAERP